MYSAVRLCLYGRRFSLFGLCHMDCRLVIAWDYQDRVLLQSILLYRRIVPVDVLDAYVVCLADGEKRLPFKHDVRIADLSVHSYLLL